MEAASGGIAYALVALALGLGLYLLPVIVAFHRGHHQRAAIAALTVLLGWTGLGWAAALIWALTDPHAVRLADPPLAGPADGAPAGPRKTCPDCAEQVAAAARICWRCRHDFGGAEIPGA